MKKVLVMVIVAIMMISLLGCNRVNRYDPDVTIRTYKEGLEEGRYLGNIRYTRYSYYGTSNYEKAKEAREFYKSKGFVVSDVRWDRYSKGRKVFWITVMKIAE